MLFLLGGFYFLLLLALEQAFVVARDFTDVEDALESKTDVIVSLVSLLLLRVTVLGV